MTDTSDLPTDTGSLVSAINQANLNPNPAGSLIEFSKSVFSTPQTITLTSTLDLYGSAGPISIAGPGANLLTISGNRTVEVFEIDFETTAVLSGLTISGGVSSREERWHFSMKGFSQFRTVLSRTTRSPVTSGKAPEFTARAY